jgi:hypothetical protein
MGKVIPFPNSGFTWPERPHWVLPADDDIAEDDDPEWVDYGEVCGPDTPMRLYIDLVDAKPRVSREVMVPGDLTMDQVHEVIVAAMGWQDYHLHAFIQGGVDNPTAPRLLTQADVAEGEEGLLESEVRLFQVLRRNGDEVGHEYDFGDGWQHVVRLIASGDEADAIPPGDPVWAVASRDADPAARVRLIDGHGACPPEDIGGIHHYNEVAAWLRGDRGAAVDDPEGLLRWLPEGFDPREFDIAEAQARLAATQAAGGIDPGALSGRMREALDRVGPARRELAGMLIGAALPRRGERHAIDELSVVEVARAARPWLILFDEIPDSGLKLTAAGYLPPAVVSRIFVALGFGPDAVWGKGNREDNVRPVLELREAAISIGLVRKARGMLHLTAEGRAGQADLERLVARVVSRLPLGSRDYERDAGLLGLLALASVATYPPDVVPLVWPTRLREAIELFAAFGWRQGYDPVPEWTVRGLMRPTFAALTRMGAFESDRYGDYGMPSTLGPALARAALSAPRTGRAPRSPGTRG